MLPKSLAGVKPRIVASEGGVASGVVTEGMGYGLMIEGFLAAKGNKEALDAGLGLMKSWIGFVNGPGDVPQPFAGGSDFNDSSTKVDYWPYGISAVEWSHKDLAPAGVAAWKFPIKKDEIESFMGSATDGDQDALLGMIYLAGALEYPDDFVDMVMRTLISFASADLGFPDLYRTLPDGKKVFVPKLGSMWGGLLPPGGKFKTKQEPWCYSPGYFAPAHYRSFRKFAKKYWRQSFDDYMPKHLDGKRSNLDELLDAFDSAVTAGYNILYYSSCASGTVSNWVGVEAACDHNDTLSCPGVPWRYTPWVGPHGGKCAQSGTDFGSYGADASRAAWRISMDYVLFREESTDVMIYDRDGNPDRSVSFGARSYLNRIVVQYKTHSTCDGGVPGACMKYSPSPYELAHAFDKKYHAPNLNCSGVPFQPESWWAGFMAYPTFTAFVAPYDEIGAAQMTAWMDTLCSICDFTSVNTTDFASGGKPEGKICLTSYFEASQAVISTLIMADNLVPMPEHGKNAAIDTVTVLRERSEELDSVLPDEKRTWQRRLPVDVGGAIVFKAFLGLAAVGGLVFFAAKRRSRHQTYAQLGLHKAELAPGSTKSSLLEAREFA